MKVKAFTAGAAFVVSLTAAGCRPAGTGPDVMADGSSVAQCGDFLSNTEALAKLRKSDSELRRSLDGATSAPEVAAKEALEAGDYRLAAATTPDGVTTELYNAQCRVLGGLRPWTVRVLTYVPDEAAAMGKGPDDKVTDYGRRYNAVVLSDPRYPYADICRELNRAGTKPDFSEAGEKGIELPYGFAELGPARMAYGLGAAARRGSVHDITVLIDRDRQDVNTPDLFGMTPLAWAVAYHRWPAAEALLRAKASPTGASCQTVIDRESPLQVARIMRWSGMIRRLRPLVTEDEFANLRQKPRWEDASLSELNHALSELKDRYDKVLSKRPFSRHDVLFDIDEKGNSVACRMEPGSNSPEFDKELCGLAIDIVHWAPARDAFGTPVPESAKLVVGIGGT